MNFEINQYLLRKMGWFDYHQSIGIGLKQGLNLFESDDLVRFFILIENREMLFLIKELSDFEKQKSKNTYKFIITDYTSDVPSINFVEFNSNDELFKLIIKHEACDGDYERHFKINKLLKKK